MLMATCLLKILLHYAHVMSGVMLQPVSFTHCRSLHLRQRGLERLSPWETLSETSSWSRFTLSVSQRLVLFCDCGHQNGSSPAQTIYLVSCKSVRNDGMRWHKQMLPLRTLVLSAQLAYHTTIEEGNFHLVGLHAKSAAISAHIQSPAVLL